MTISTPSYGKIQTTQTGGQLQVAFEDDTSMGSDNDYNDGYAAVVATPRQNCGCDGLSTAPIAYSNGAPSVNATDLNLPGFGLDWTESRSWTTDPVSGGTGLTGNGWIGGSQVTASAVGTSISINNSGTSPELFNFDGTNYIPDFGSTDALVKQGTGASTRLVLTKTDGTVERFFGFDAAIGAQQQGRLDTVSDANGDTTTIHYTSGQITSVDRSSGTGASAVSEQLVYSYGTTGGETGRLIGIVQNRSVGGGSYVPVRSVKYEYYNGDAYGNAGDLQRVTIRKGALTGSVISTNYYRYYTPTSISTITRGTYASGQATATATIGTNDLNIAIGDTVTVTGAPSAFSGTFAVTGVTSTTVQFSIFGSEMAIPTSTSAAGMTLVVHGYAGGLKYALDTASYDRLAKAVSDPLLATNAQVATYATENFAYDVSKRVTQEIAQGAGCSACSGGYGTFTYSYAENLNTGYVDGYNNWENKTTETLADGNQNIVYTNAYGQVMLKIFKSGTQQWINYYRYDSSGRQILHANPSAVTGFDETKLDLVDMTDTVNFHATYLSDTNGLLDIFDYPTVTTGGDVIGYLRSEQIRHGDQGTSITVRAYTYATHTAGSSTIYPVASETEYSGTGGTGARTTNFTYTWLTGTNQMATRTTSHPTISTAENGSGSAVSEVAYYDAFGRAVWVVDGSGYITYNAYDNATSAMTTQIRDVNTSLLAPAAVSISGITSSGTLASVTTSGANAFAVGQTVKIAGAGQAAYNGTFVIASVTSSTQFMYVMASSPGVTATGTLTALLATPAGGGLHLTTSMAVDDQGRTTMVTDPNMNVTYTVYNDVTHETRVYRGWNATTGMATGPTEVTRNDRLNSYSETLTMSATPTVSGSAGSYAPTGTEVVSNVQSLSRDLVNGAGQIVEHDVYTSLSGTTYTQTAQQFGTVGVNYLATLIGYDWRGRRARVTAPDGTITQTVFDGLGRVASIYKGTNNSGWTQTDPTGGGASGNNMVQVSGNVYDNGGVGDSNLTASTQFSGSASYETDDVYDFRDRMIGMRGPDGVAIQYVLDNLDEQTETDTYVDANSNFSVDAGELVGKSTVAYDEWGRAYQTTTYQNSRSLATGALTSSGTTATVTLANHGFSTGQSVTIAGATQTAYDGTFAITVTGANTFTLTLATSTTSPATGSRITVTADKRLTTNTWYDPRGNMAKALNANGLINKWFYDSADRLVRTDTDADPTEVSSGTYIDALSLTNDQVIEQNDYWLDKGGRTRIATNWKRDGKQVSSTTGVPTADVYDHSTVAYWYDTADRLTATADYGRDGAEAGAASTDAMVWNQTGYSYKDSNSDGNPQHGIPNNGIPDVLDATSPGWDNFSNAATDYVYRWITTTYGYDAAGRQSTVTDNAERVQQTLYDLAGRTTSVVNNYNGSAVTAGTAGDTDQTTQYVYDNFGRLSQQIALNPKGSSIEQQKTTYLYGSDVDRSWVTATLYPDSADTTSVDSTGKGTVSTGTDHTSTTYDRLGRQATATDQRGVVHTFTYDSAGRFSTDSIGTAALPTGVDGTVRSIAYTYDDQSRIATVTSYDGTTPTPVALNQVAYTYDAWGNVTRDAEEHGGTSSGGLVTSTTPAVNYLYTDGSGTTTTAKSVHLSKVLYPANNGTTIGTALDRISTISDGSSNILVQYYWIGIAQRINQTFHPQVSGGLEMNDGTQSGDYSGLDRYYRFAKMQWQTNSGSTNFEQRFGKYDRMGSLLRTDSSPASGAGDTNFDQAYTYDGLERLTSYNRGNLNGMKLIASPNFTQTWTLDALGNWTAFSQTNNSTSINGTALTTYSQTRTANAANEITGFTPNAAAGGYATATYDAAGNQTLGPKGDAPTTQIGYVYDGWNRLVGVDANVDGDLYDQNDVKYSYDGLGRRITKFTDSTNDSTNNAGSTEEYYQNEANQVLEVRIGTVTGGTKTININPKERYLWDLSYVDAPVDVELDTNTDGTRDYRLWFTWDLSHNISSILTDGGKVVEHYTYTPHGSRVILNGASNYAGTGADPDGAEYTVDSNGSDYGELLGFQGLRNDPESGASEADNRITNPVEEWTQRDPDDYIDGANLYQALGSNPINNVDPTGDNYSGDLINDALSLAANGFDQWVDGNQKRIVGDVVSALKLSAPPKCDGSSATLEKHVPVKISFPNSRFDFTATGTTRYVLPGGLFYDYVYDLFTVKISGKVEINADAVATYQCCKCNQPGSNALLQKIVINSAQASAKVQMRIKPALGILDTLEKDVIGLKFGIKAKDLFLSSGPLSFLSGVTILDLGNLCGEET